MKQLGARRLTGAELLGIVLGSGVSRNGESQSAIELGQELIKRYGGLHALSKREPGELKQVPGSAFEAVDSSSLQIDPDSGATQQLPPVAYLPTLRILPL